MGGVGGVAPCPVVLVLFRCSNKDSSQHQEFMGIICNPFQSSEMAFYQTLPLGSKSSFFSKKGQKVKVFYLQKYEKHKFLSEKSNLKTKTLKRLGGGDPCPVVFFLFRCSDTDSSQHQEFMGILCNPFQSSEMAFYQTLPLGSKSSFFSKKGQKVKDFYLKNMKIINSYLKKSNLKTMRCSKNA